MPLFIQIIFGGRTLHRCWIDYVALARSVMIVAIMRRAINDMTVVCTLLLNG